ncbi:MAG: hypothetical protein KC731_31510, partial [Myxococcales bacterium]|nr:hypothetical protein [Myxococcales bacterium]
PMEVVTPRESLVRRGDHAVALLEAEIAPVGALPAVAGEVWGRRVSSIRSSEQIRLLEQPVNKRLWRDTEDNVSEYAFREQTLRHHATTVRLDMAERIVSNSAVGVGLRKVVERLDRTRFDLATRLDGESDGDDTTTVLQSLLEQEAIPFLAAYRLTEPGLEKRAAWEKTWDLQRREDRGEDVGTIPVPPKYDQKDFRDPSFYRLRGKLDVPKERFISYPGCESDEDGEPLYGWAGWTPYERAQALMALDELAEQAEVPVAERHGLLAGLAFLVPYVRWGLPRPDGTLDLAAARTAATEIEAILRDLLGREGMTEAQLAAWAKAHPPPKTRAPRKKRAKNHD